MNKTFTFYLITAFSCLLASSLLTLPASAQSASDFPFDATAGSGFAWHCHLLPHEDNEMMRPFMVVSAGQGNALLLPVAIALTTVAAVIVGFLGYLHIRRRSKK